ncbi:MAG: TetR/AcrR family transcriptional regulator [Phycisphaerales bacterium]|nr:TetR/AcrR family transcriptional regulator [Phycisphaerales bacterium]
MNNAPENSGSVPVRDRLLDAAEQIAARDGVSTLTLEAVAHEAGVSKGGLLYHFPAKSALITAIVERLGERCESRQATEVAADSQPRGAFTRAYLAVRSSSLEPDREPVHSAILAALGTDPGYLDPIRERLATWQARLESDGIDPVTASIVRLAIDGLILGRLLKVPVPEGELRDRVIEKLLSMTYPQRDEP